MRHGPQYVTVGHTARELGRAAPALFAAVNREDLPICEGTRSLLRLRDVERWASTLLFGAAPRRFASMMKGCAANSRNGSS